MKIVIVGGGFCGSFCARKLERKFEVTLIDCNDYFEFTPGIPRVLFDTKDIDEIRIKHKKYLKKTNILVGAVKKIEKKFVVADIDNKNIRLDYDYLIITAGSRYNMPFKSTDAVAIHRSQYLKDCAQEIKKAENILVIGGGLVGVEIASETLCKTKKNVALIEAGERLMQRTPIKASNISKEFLEKKGCKVMLNQKIVGPCVGEKCFVTQNGDKIDVDFAFICTGIQPNMDMIDFYDKTKISQNSYLIVDSHLHVDKNIFAGGDIIHLREEKTAQNSRTHAKVICKNIIRHIKGKKLIEYKAKKTPLVISLGPYNGIFINKNFVFSGFIPGMLKHIIEKMVIFEYKFLGFFNYFKSDTI